MLRCACQTASDGDTLRHGSGISELGTSDEVRDYGSAGDAACQAAPSSEEALRVSNRTRQLQEQGRRDFAKLGEDERRVAKRAISTSCREDHSEHVNGILDYREAAGRCGNSQEVSRQTRLASLWQTTHAQYQPTQISQWRPACHTGPTSG